MRQPEFRDEPRERERLFEWIQVLALDVLDERERDRVLVVHAAHDRGDVGNARDLGGAPAALAGDDLVALLLARLGRADGPHDDRLNDALGLDRIRQIRERFLAHVHARLVFAARKQVERQVQQLLARRRHAGRGPRPGLAEERLETTPQAVFLVTHHRHRNLD